MDLKDLLELGVSEEQAVQILAKAKEASEETPEEDALSELQKALKEDDDESDDADDDDDYDPSYMKKNMKRYMKENTSACKKMMKEMSKAVEDFDFDAEIDESLFGLGPDLEPDDVDEDKLIIHPGVGMVDLPLGADQAKIKEILGPPDFMVGEGLYQYTGLLVVAREGKVYAFHCGDGNKPDSRHVTGCKIRTKEGIGMDSTGQDVINAYGQPDDKRDVKILKGGSRWLYRSTATIFGLYDGKVHYMIFQQPKQR